MRRLLLAADVVGLLVAFVLAQLLVPIESTADTVGAEWELVVFIVSIPLWILLARLHGLYERDDERTDHSTIDDVVGILHVVTLGTFGFLVATTVTGLAQPTISRLIVFWFLAVTTIVLLRVGARVVGRRTHAYEQNAVIVGSGQVARLLRRKIENHPEYGLRIVGLVDRDAMASGHDADELIGRPDTLATVVQEHDVDRVIVAFSTDSHEQTLDVIRSAQSQGVQVDIVPRLFEVLGSNVQLHTVEGVPLLGIPAPRLSPSSQLLKRSFDLVTALGGLILLSPLLLVTAVAIKLDSRGPVFFRQVRMGAGEESFRIFKFRTMYEDAEIRKAEVAHMNMHQDGDPRMFKVPDDPRVTRVGKYLRRWRVDELPQLFNVVSGEMSLVGPRPLILDEDVYVQDWARRRLNLKPGITGLWQVLGASDIPFEEMTTLDYLYVTNWSLSEDLRLIGLTIPSLLRARRAY